MQNASQEGEPLTSVGLVDAHLAAIIECSYDAIISKTLDGIIQSWNPAASRLFGYTPEEAIGRSILMLIPENRHDEETSIIARIRAGERVETFETFRQRKDGSLVPVSITISPIRDASGKIVGASKIARDISQARESERHIRLLLREVNHRVKNQYAVILSIIRETASRAEDPRDFEQMMRERVLSLSRSHDLLVEAEWRGADLAELIQGQLSPYGHENLIGLAGPSISINPTAVQALGMAFHELGTNSAKYGVLGHAAGRIEVSWSVVPGAEGTGFFRLEWQETPPEAAMSLFPQDGPERRGFGSVVLRRVVPQSIGGSSEYDLTEVGARWLIEAPLDKVLSD